MPECFKHNSQTYDVHLGLIGKRVVDFLLVIIELFSLGVTAEALRTKTDRKSAISLQRGQFGPKFQVEGVVWAVEFLENSPSHTALICIPETEIDVVRDVTETDTATAVTAAAAELGTTHALPALELTSQPLSQNIK